MSDYNYEIIKASVMQWYTKVLYKLKSKDKIILSKNSDDVLIIDFDFRNCIAQLSVNNSQFMPYQFVYFEAMDIETSNQIYCFYDDDTKQERDVISALDKALIFCSNYKVRESKTSKMGGNSNVKFPEGAADFNFGRNKHELDR